MTDNTIMNTGLRGVTIASTKISDVDGTLGKLVYRGYLIKELAEKISYEEVVHLLLFESLPNRIQLNDVRKKLNENSHLPDAVINAMKAFPKDSLPMDVLQSAVPMLANHDPKIKKNISRELALETGLNLIAKISSIVAGWERIRKGLAPVQAAPELNHAANFLYMLKGKKPEKEVARFFDTALVLHAEHSFNASTFAAREVASTRAHMYAAIAAAIGSLSGELHGGANTRVMEMLKKIGSTDKIEGYVEGELKAGRKVMGLGHALYKVDDPRALILAPMARKMGQIAAGDTKWFSIAENLESSAKEAFKKEKKMDIFVNVDYYSAPLYYSMGIPMDLFTPVFAVSRIAGWVSHIIEEQFAEAAPEPVLYRPESEYVGSYCGKNTCTYKEIDER